MYKCIMLPGHHRAFPNGTVYEHIVIAEQNLGRELKPEEVVHHKDEDKLNNNPSNLMVFSTKVDHTRYHSGRYILIDNNDGTFSTKENLNKCPICGKIIEYRAKTCSECLKREIPKKRRFIKIFK